MLKAILSLLRKLLPEPDFETRPNDLSDELEMKKLKVRMMIEGRML